VELKAILKPTFSKKQNILETFDFYSIQMYHLCKSISQEVFFHIWISVRLVENLFVLL